MKKILLTCWVLLIACCISAQTVKDEIYSNINLSGSNLLAYPTPTKDLTPAPAGEKPFYISHYGRHGSRYLIDPNDHDFPYRTLEHADSLGKLTDLGKKVLLRIYQLKAEAKGRLGELTLLGALQHRQIAFRMYKRFPEIFAGRTNIDAKSTIVIRCILSMENELLEFTRLNPLLNITHDASKHDMYYMNLTDTVLNNRKMPPAAKVALDNFYHETVHEQPLMKRLFNDTSYVAKYVDVRLLNQKLFNLAVSVQNVELQSKISLYDIFTKEELYNNWLVNNAWWYITYGPSPLNGGTQPYSQRNLLHRIIEEADSCIRLSHPGATLRFGHETMVMPLVCLLDLDNYGETKTSLEQLVDKGWVNYRIFPMGANVQFIFYRKNAADKDVLVKVLLNENEATLPVKTDKAPYYHWKDVRAYYLDKLNKYNGN